MAFTKYKIKKIEKYLEKQKKKQGGFNLLEIHRALEALATETPSTPPKETSRNLKILLGED
ncbi:MAG: hypothetical protein KJ915_09535 [Candidatus Omnitrophica bacterium]|nr:hypothetical protein [Candidatus Omnitrophota bacterium]